MSRTRIDEMLQECLDGYEAGLTPEECLSAYPEQRDALEPLLRQALSLRVAYATTPSDAFRFQAREQLMFAAGRDVKLALAREPDPNFILQERTRFLNVAGAEAQEALRDVAPPRLAFWVNARRRLLETAATTRPAPIGRFAGMLRYSLSAAVVAIVVAVFAAVSLDGGNSTTTPGASADAQLAALEEEISSVEQRSQLGQPIEARELEDLVEKTSLITDAIDVQDAAQAEKIGGLILRQQEVVAQQTDSSLTEAEQTLLELQQKLGTTATSTTEPVAAVVPSDESADIGASDEPTPAPTTNTLAIGEVRIEPTLDTALGLTWLRVSTDDVTFLIPDSWQIDLEPNDDGTFTETLSFLEIKTDGAEPISLLVTGNGFTVAEISQLPLQLRGPGPDGETIAFETLADLGEVGVALWYLAQTVQVSPNP